MAIDSISITEGTGRKLAVDNDNSWSPTDYPAGWQRVS